MQSPLKYTCCTCHPSTQYTIPIHRASMELLKNLVVLALFAFFLSRVIESSLKLHDPKIAVSLKRVRQVVLKLLFLTQNWTKWLMFLQYKVGEISLNCNMCGQFVVHQCLTIWRNCCWCRGIQWDSVLSRGQAVLFQWNLVGIPATCSHGLGTNLTWGLQF